MYIHNTVQNQNRPNVTIKYVIQSEAHDVFVKHEAKLTQSILLVCDPAMPA